MGERSPRRASSESWRDLAPANLDSRALSQLLKAGSDIMLILDPDGIVREIAIEDEALATTIGSSWLDQPMLDTVTIESRSKVQAMLASPDGNVVRQEINHAIDGKEDLPVRYTAIRLAPGGYVAAIGRDLRDIARLQQQLVDATVAVERDYAFQRATEVQFRVLFQNVADAVIIADALSRRIVEANPRAEDLLNRSARRLANTEFDALFADGTAHLIQDGFAAVRALGQVAWGRLPLKSAGPDVAAAGWLIRNSLSPQVLLRLSPADASPPTQSSRIGGSWEALRRLPEPLVATDSALAILDANESFLDLVGVASVDQAKGVPLSRFLGRHGVDLDILASRLNDVGAIRGFASLARGAHGLAVPVEVSAAPLADGAARTCVFLLRVRPDDPPPLTGKPPIKAADEMTELVGRMPLREIVRETSDLIEELCIEAALGLTKDNRASAAEMLGLSRQSLYAKLRRYGLGDLPGDEGSAPDKL